MWKFREDMLNHYINGTSNRTFKDAEDRLNYLEEKEQLSKQNTNNETIYNFLSYVHSKKNEYSDEENTGWSMSELIMLANDYMEESK